MSITQVVDAVDADAVVVHVVVEAEGKVVKGVTDMVRDVEKLPTGTVRVKDSNGGVVVLSTTDVVGEIDMVGTRGVVVGTRDVVGTRVEVVDSRDVAVDSKGVVMLLLED